MDYRSAEKTCVQEISEAQNMFSSISYPSYNNGGFVIYFAKGYTLN